VYVIRMRKEAVITRVDATGLPLTDGSHGPGMTTERGRVEREEYYVFVNYPSKKPTGRRKK